MTSSDPGKIIELSVANLTANIVTIAVTEYGLFSFLSENSSSSQEVSQKLKIAMRPAEAMLNACVALDLLEKKGEKYALSALSQEYLVKGSPSYMGDFFEIVKGNNYGQLQKAMLTDSPNAYEDGDTWKKHEVDEEKVRFFTRAMHGLSVAPGKAIAEIFDFSKFNAILDIGGGSGTIPIMIALEHPHIQGTIFDIPAVCPVAEEFIAKYKLEDRIKIRAGDMFKDPFPAGADIVLLSNIIHDWNEEKGNCLIEKAYRCLPTGGIIIINEVLLNEDKTGPLYASLATLAMLVWTDGGRQYTGREISLMLKNNGFSNIEIKPTAAYYSIITGQKL